MSQRGVPDEFTDFQLSYLDDHETITNLTVVTS